VKKILISVVLIWGILTVYGADTTSSKLSSENSFIRMNALQKKAKSFISSSPDSVLKYSLKLEEEAIQNDDPKFLIAAQAYTGQAYEYKGSYQKALSYYYSMLELALDLDEKVQASTAYTNLAIIMLTLGNYNQSVNFSLESLAIYEELGDKRGISSAIKNLGSVYLQMSDYETSLSYYQQALELKADLKDSFAVRKGYHNIALVYLAMEDYRCAKDYFDLALENDELKSDLHTLASTYFNYGILLYETSQFEEAEKLNQKSISLLENMGLIPSMLNFYLQRSEILLALHKPAEAFEYIQKFGNSIIMADNLSLKAEYYSALKGYYKEIGDFTKAFHFQERHIEIADSLKLNQQASTIANLQISYDMEVQQQELSLILAEHKLKKNNLTIIGLICAILLITLIISVISNLNKKRSIKVQKMIEAELRSNEEKLRKFMDSATEIINIYNSDLNLIDINNAGMKSFGEDVKKADVIGKNITELVDNVHLDGRLATYKRVLSTGDPVSLYDIHIDGKSGERFLDIRAFRVGENLGMIISDISESKMAKEKLQQSESKLLALFQAMDDIIFVFDKEGTYINIAPTNLDKLYRTKENLLGKKLTDVFEGSKGEFFMVKLEECIAWQQTVPIEYSIPINGIEQWFDGRFSPMSDDKVVLVVRDITARKRNEEIIRRSEERYKNLLDTMQEGMALLNANNIIIYVNPKAEEIFGTSGRNIIGKSVKDVLHDVNQQGINYHDKLMRKGKFYRFQTEIINSSKKKLILSVSESPIFEAGEFSGSFVLFNDVTEKIKNEHAIIESEAFNRAVVSNSPLAISARDKFGRLINANKSWMKMWDKMEIDLEIDKQERKELILDERDKYLGDFRQEVVRVYQEGGDFFIPKLFIEAKDKWISQHFYAIMESDGKVDRVIIITEDITEETRANLQLMQSIKDKEILIKEVHHRVKNNLQIISSLLRMQSESINDPKILDMFTNSLNRIRSLSLVHEKIFSSESLEEVDFAGFIKSLCNMISSSAPYSNKRLSVIPDVKVIRLDISKAVSCGLIINELLSNAYRHGFDEGETGKVYIHFTLEENMYKLVVDNNGKPLPKDFDYKEVNTLGMQLVSALLMQLKGSLEIDSSSTTKFIIRFKR